MLDEYQLLAREQLICGAQVHVGVPDRDVAVAVAHRVAPVAAGAARAVGQLAVLDGPGQRLRQHPLAGLAALADRRRHRARSPPPPSTTALVADLVASGTITDPAMIYFDVRPSAHLPTVELRVTDACPDVDDVVLLAGLFRALVRREVDAVRAGVPTAPPRGPAAARRDVAGGPLRAGG